MKKLKIEHVQETIKLEGVQTKSLDETIKTILENLIPDDEQESETHWHKNIRKEIESPPDTEDTPAFTAKEIEKAISSLGNRKAPVCDQIEPEMLKRAWPIHHAQILKLYNCCLHQNVFPSQWKKAEIKVLLKSPEKPATDVKSYRPISLLSVLGKVLEKLIAGRLDHHPIDERCGCETKGNRK